MLSENFQQCCAAVSLVLPQIAKLLIIPFVCMVEHFWLGKQFSVRVIMSVVTVVVGVGVV
jgi:hypothetical protein